MKKWLIYGIGAFLLILLITSYQAKLLPIVFESSTIIRQNSEIEIRKGDTIRLFDQYNFNSANYALYIVFYDQEAEYPKVLFTNQKEDLNELKKTFVFVYTDGDMTTCESFMYLLKDEKIVLKTGISVDKTSGLQSSQYGWIEFLDPKGFIESLNRLKPVYNPFVSL